jgi:hypothetical protein
MDGNIVEFPSAQLPTRPFTTSEISDLHSTAFRDMEGNICDLERMGEIAQQLILECSAQDDDDLRKLELTIFAMQALAKMLREFKANYHKRWHGELKGSS